MTKARLLVFMGTVRNRRAVIVHVGLCGCSFVADSCGTWLRGSGGASQRPHPVLHVDGLVAERQRHL